MFFNRIGKKTDTSLTKNLCLSCDLICWSVLNWCFCFEQLQSEVEKPFLTFRENFKKDMKRFDHHIADLRKQLAGRYAAVEKVKTQIWE